MASLNKVQLIGNLGKDIELKQLQTTSVANLAVATSEKWTKDGQTKEHTEWHNVTVWGKTAENCAKYLKKGSKVYVDGKIKTEVYEKNGENRYATKIVAHSVLFLGSREGGSSTGYPQAQKPQASPQSYDPDISLDDIPF